MVYRLLALSALLVYTARYRSCRRSTGFAGVVEKN